MPGQWKLQAQGQSWRGPMVQLGHSEDLGATPQPSAGHPQADFGLLERKCGYGRDPQ